MFNLEKSIAEWRGQMQSAGVKNPEALDELESHLREDIERRARSGESEEHAFKRAVQDIGEASTLKREFAKLGQSWFRKLKRIIAEFYVPVPAMSALSPGARSTLERARQEAPRLNHGFIGTEHVLLGLLALENGVVPNVFKNLGVAREDIKHEIEKSVSSFPSGNIPAQIPYTPRVKKSLHYAAREARYYRDCSVGPEHLLLGLILESDGVAGRVLRDFGFTPEKTRAEIFRQRSM